MGGLFHPLGAQDVPGVLWTRTYGGSNTDRGRSVQQTLDGGFVVVGWTNSFGAGDIDVYLIRTDATGDTLWTRTYGGSGSDYGFSIQQTSDSGFVVAGYTQSFGAGDIDVYLIRTDPTGDTLWTKTYGSSQSDLGFSVQQTTDGGFVVTGSTTSFGAGSADVYLIRTDAQGDTLWTRTFGGSSSDRGYSVQQTTDGGLVVAGVTSSFGAGLSNVWLIRTDANGDTLWTRTFGGSSFDLGSSVQQTSDGGFVLAGWTSSFGAGSADVWLIRTDAQGETLWTRTYGGSHVDIGQSVQQTANGGFVVVGNTGSFGAGVNDVYIIRADTQGDTLWTRTYGGSNVDIGQSVQQTASGGFVLAGFTASFGASGDDVWFIRLGEGGLQVEPTISSIADVSQDQGRQALLHWWASYHDLFFTVTQYSIRLQDPAGEWIELGTVTARQADSYTYLTPTFGDSSANGIVWSRFQVTAHTNDPVVYYTSPVDSGYSIDNLAPAAPTGLVASVTEGLVVSLAWNGPVDHDFDFFRVYRQAATDTAMTLAESPEPAYTDTTAQEGKSYDYWVAALDINGNESNNSQPVSLTVLGTEEAPGLPTEFALHPNYPNPFNPTTTIRFDLPEAAAVTLLVYDLRGRELARLVDLRLEAGYHRVSWNGQATDGREVPTGIYVARLVTPEHTKSIKMVLLK